MKIENGVGIIYVDNGEQILPDYRVGLLWAVAQGEVASPQERIRMLRDMIQQIQTLELGER